jgi:para-nitrobenzyl esterase
VARQELIVEAALTGNVELAKIALATDPLVRDPATVAPMFAELREANAASLAAGEEIIAALDIAAGEIELETVNVEDPVVDTGAPAGGYSVAHSTIQQLLNDKQTRSILETYFPGMLADPRLAMGAGMTLKQVAPFAPQILTEEKLNAIDEELAQL